MAGNVGGTTVYEKEKEECTKLVEDANWRSETLKEGVALLTCNELRFGPPETSRGQLSRAPSSVITSKAANGYQFKTGQRTVAGT